LQRSKGFDYNKPLAWVADPANRSLHRVSFLTKYTKQNVQFVRWLYLSVIAVLVLMLWPAHPARSDNFVLYFPNSRSILPLKTYENVRYLPVLKLLNLFGHVEGLQEKKKSLKVWFGSTQIRFREKNLTVQLNNAKFRLSNPVRTLDGEWMVPVDFLTQVLPTLVNQTVEYQMGEDRIFIGNIKPNSFTLQLQSLPGGAQLTFQFAEPVSLRTAARNGKWILYLGEHPVEPIKSNFQFRNTYISRVHFDDQDGHPKLIVTPAMAGLDFYPKLSKEGKLLVTDIIKPEAVATPPATAAPNPPPLPNPVPSQAPAAAASRPLIPAQVPNLSLPAVVLDAGHGGSDPGARGGDGLLEKNLTAQLVARVSKALMATGRYRVVLTRVGDQTVDFEQRATEANVAHPVAFISFHAGNLGPSTPRVMVYTYRPSSPEALASTAGPQSLFTSWAKIQLTYLGRSRQFAQVLQQDLEKTSGVAPSAPMEVPVKALQSIAAPAVAIEVGSLASGTDSAALTRPSFQDQIAAAVVHALADFQGGPS
jgi:N-acetylmuramoyl-L-alanine amidase